MHENNGKYSQNEKNPFGEPELNESVVLKDMLRKRAR
jgi:hypothetical protein